MKLPPLEFDDWVEVFLFCLGTAGVILLFTLVISILFEAISSLV